MGTTTTFSTTKAGTKLYLINTECERNDQMSVITYGTRIYMTTKELSVAENTWAGYQTMLEKYVYPAVGNCPMADITPLMLRTILADFQRSGMSHSSAVKLFSVMNGLFDMAYKDGLIPKSPMDVVDRPRAKHDRKCANDFEKAYTADELVYILQCLYKEPLKWRVFVRVMADTGCRRGEVCGLHWEDIDFENAVISVRHNLQYTPGKGVYDTIPKNYRARRVDIDPELLPLLRELKKEQDRTAPSDWVFTQKNSATPIFPQSPTRYFRGLAKRYGISNFHPHILRHTSASIAIKNGADIASVSRRLGHTDPSVTLRMYTHADVESIRRAGRTMRNALKEAAHTEGLTDCSALIFHYTQKTPYALYGVFAKVLTTTKLDS